MVVCDVEGNKAKLVYSSVSLLFFFEYHPSFYNGGLQLFFLWLLFILIINVIRISMIIFSLV